MVGSIHPITNFQDFLEVYKTFEGFPYFEVWEKEKVNQVYQIARQSGYLYGYYKDSKCIGIISATIVNKDTISFDDLAVLPKYRKNGIGTQLTEHLLEIAKKDSFKFAYFRYSDSNPMILGIAKRLGFKKDHERCEVISHPRHRNVHVRSNEDLRFFMCKYL